MKVWTRSGILFDVINPDPKQVRIPDIVFPLAQTCRFNGQLSNHYSVAAHSIVLSRMVPESLRNVALLHDAAEAYIGDIIQPIKREIPGIGIIERRVLVAIEQAIKIPFVDQMATIAEYDTLLCEIEMSQFFPVPEPIHTKGTNLEPVRNLIRLFQGMPSHQVALEFLAEITGLIEINKSKIFENITKPNGN